LSNSTPSFFVDLIKYFGDQADDIQAKASKAGIFDNKSDIGSTREDILFDFLSFHIPTRCNIIKEDLFLIPLVMGLVRSTS